MLQQIWEIAAQPSQIRDADLWKDWEREVTEYVCNCLFLPFPRCERECRVALGRPRERRLKRQSQLPHRAPARSKSQARPSWVEGPGLGLGAAGVPQAFSSSSSHQHKGDWDHAGSLLRKGWAKTWQNGLTEACIYSQTHTNSKAFTGRLSCLWAWWETKKIT